MRRFFLVGSCSLFLGLDRLLHPNSIVRKPIGQHGPCSENLHGEREVISGRMCIKSIPIWFGRCSCLVLSVYWAKTHLSPDRAVVEAGTNKEGNFLINLWLYTDAKPLLPADTWWEVNDPHKTLMTREIQQECNNAGVPPSHNLVIGFLSGYLYFCFSKNHLNKSANKSRVESYQNSIISWFCVVILVHGHQSAEWCDCAPRPLSAARI